MMRSEWSKPNSKWLSPWIFLRRENKPKSGFGACEFSPKNGEHTELLVLNVYQVLEISRLVNVFKNAKFDKSRQSHYFIG